LILALNECLESILYIASLKICQHGILGAGVRNI
jgi:hypothetical protein